MSSKQGRMQGTMVLHRLEHGRLCCDSCERSYAPKLTAALPTPDVRSSKKVVHGAAETTPHFYDTVGFVSMS